MADTIFTLTVPAARAALIAAETMLKNAQADADAHYFARNQARREGSVRLARTQVALDAAEADVAYAQAAVENAASNLHRAEYWQGVLS